MWCATLSLAFLTVFAGGLAGAQEARRWTDPAAHEVRFVTVDEGVTLEVLDWGGSGRALVLIAGSGNTGHVFDDFVPQLRDCCHVYAITRRGYGASSRPPSGYADQRLADDVFQAIERLRIDKPILVGHSMAGGEMTTIGRQHSDRISGIVYIDALGDLEDDPAADQEWLALQQKLPPGLQRGPKCGPVDRSTFAEYRRTWGCTLGFMLPEAELRAAFEPAGEGVGAYRIPEWVSPAIGKGQVYRRDYSGIRVPVLALMNGAQTTDQVLKATGYEPTNEKERAAIDAFMARSRIVFGRIVDKLTRHVPDARVLWYPNAGHYLFLTRQADVLRELHAFVAAVDAKRR